MLTTYTNLSCLSTLQVNNAGIAGRGTIKNTSLEDFDKVMNINVRLVVSPFCFPFLAKYQNLIMCNIVWNGPKIHGIIFGQLFYHNGAGSFGISELYFT